MTHSRVLIELLDHSTVDVGFHHVPPDRLPTRADQTIQQPLVAHVDSVPLSVSARVMNRLMGEHGMKKRGV
jgi:hypothetical protein